MVDNAVAKIIETWCHLVEKEVKQQEVVLAASAMRAYIEGLASIKDIGTGQTLLPACFDIYASCVESILDECLDFTNIENTIKITTLLSKPLRQWYNISTELRNGKKCALTREKWEKYKLNIANKLKSKYNTIHNIQMRRIITNSALESNEQMLYVNGQQAVLTVDQALAVDIPDDVKLLPEVSNSLEFGDRDWLIHLIGLASNLDEAKIKVLRTNGWVAVNEHFSNSYHNKQHTAKAPISPLKKGVFFIYQPNVKIEEQYKDLFVVEMNASNGGAFGIAFVKDNQRELSGIVFLDDLEINNYVKILDYHWNNAR